MAQHSKLDKGATKGVNLKRQRIAWCQKNKVKLKFDLVSQKRDNGNSPVFVYAALIEGLEGGRGEGYSKKESQQAASKAALQSLRRKPQFIDAVFAAKTERTKMEEEPVQTVPDVDAREDFIISSAGDRQAGAPAGNVAAEDTDGPEAGVKKDIADVTDEFDLSDIRILPSEMSKEDIIAAAEAEAFK